MQCLTRTQKKKLVSYLAILSGTLLLWRILSAWVSYPITPLGPVDTIKTPQIADLTATTAYLPPILERIAQCESGGSQYNEKGIILGKKNPLDRGKWQINEFYHGETARKLGFDLNTLEGNTNMALWLYERQGTKPWYLSEKCWSNPYSSSSSSSSSISSSARGTSASMSSSSESGRNAILPP